MVLEVMVVSTLKGCGCNDIDIRITHVQCLRHGGRVARATSAFWSKTSQAADQARVALEGEEQHAADCLHSRQPQSRTVLYTTPCTICFNTRLGLAITNRRHLAAQKGETAALQGSWTIAPPSSSDVQKQAHHPFAYARQYRQRPRIIGCVDAE